MKPLLLFVICFISINLFAQEPIKRTVGLSTSIQQSDLGIQIPIWIKNKATVAPFISFNIISDAGNEITIGIIPKFYLNEKKLMPFVGFKIGDIIYNPPSSSGSKSTNDLLIGGAFGGDYFFDPQFCIGVEAQINYALSDDNSDRFGNPGGSNLNTAMAVTASVFF
jgi:hypothetical protein